MRTLPLLLGQAWNRAQNGIQPLISQPRRGTLQVGPRKHRHRRQDLVLAVAVGIDGSDHARQLKP